MTAKQKVVLCGAVLMVVSIACTVLEVRSEREYYMSLQLEYQAINQHLARQLQQTTTERDRAQDEAAALLAERDCLLVEVAYWQRAQALSELVARAHEHRNAFDIHEARATVRELLERTLEGQEEAVLPVPLATDLCALVGQEYGFRRILRDDGITVTVVIRRRTGGTL